ncbi:ATP-dependent DNA ligase [Streptomyces yaizuensis]|uniref:DNA ligase n=1 Tax=Streptomyces yaizuensis TaxID=2989713 RepID=A0ABQ5NWQ6_9ACTN|nr:DNA ligase [Streptomyces sp. YSPA8]GLF94644.1 DNA ligase [Streptomyces sp. YSPA8]
MPLRPPLGVMRPRRAESIPPPDGLPGGTQYSVKLDGFRALAFVGADGGVFLQSRSGRALGPEFPRIAAHLGSVLPAGLVLDGELCAYRDGRLSFGDLLRSRADRERSGTALSYIAFDVLAVPGRDVRPLPLRERWELLGAALRDTGPPLERVLATTDEETARLWFRELRDAGVEGIVAKALASPYRAGPTWAWRKIRHADTVDGVLVGVFGPERRPGALLVRLGDGREIRVAALTAVQARQLADAVAGRLARPGGQGAGSGAESGAGAARLLTEPLPVELREVPGRHETARFVRLRSDG